MKKNLYIVGVLLSVFLWACSVTYFYKQKAGLQPRALVQSIQDDLLREQQESNDFVKKGSSLIDHLWKNNLSETELNLLKNKQYVIQLYENDRIIFWSDNSFPINQVGVCNDAKVIVDKKNVFVAQSYFSKLYPNKRINIIIPIYHHYEVSNEYIQSFYLANPYIPVTSSFSLEEFSGATAIKSLSHAPLFYFKVNAADVKPLHPNATLLILILAAIFCSVLLVHLVGVYLSRKYYTLSGSALIFIILFIGRLLIYFWGMPFELEQLEFFSPQLFARNAFLPSFGHLFLHVLSMYWLLSFTQGQLDKANLPSLNKVSSVFRFALFFFIVLLVFGFNIYIKDLFQSIVFDSDISFDTNNFDASNQFTLMAIITVAILSRLFLLSLQLGSLLINKYLPSKKDIKKIILATALVLIVGYIIVVFLSTPFAGVAKELIITILGIFWAVLYVFILRNKTVRKVFARSGLFTIVFLSVYFSILSAIYLKLNIDAKEEKITRIAFAKKLSRQQDPDLELRFDEFAAQVRKDTVIKHWFLGEQPVSIQNIYRRLKVLNSEVYFSKYNQDFYLFDKTKASIVENEVLTLDSLINIQNRSMPTMNSLLYYHVDEAEKGSYLTLIPIEKDSLTLGYLAIYLVLKSNISKSFYPELLKNTTGQDNNMNTYQYAIYSKGKLANQSGSYNFQFDIGSKLTHKQYEFVQRGDFSELYFKAAPELVYAVVYKNNFALGILTIFSFLFAISLIIGTIENWFKILATTTITGKKFKIIYNGSLSVRIKYFALGFTAISFFIIGLSTVLFLTNRYKANSLKTLESNMMNISEVVIDYLQTQKSIVSEKDLSSQVSQPDFAFFITNIAQQQKLDINIFDTLGDLAFTTQESIYQKNILSNKVNYEAYYMLKEKRLSNYIKNLNVGTLMYTASYTPIFNHENKLIGYLNIPSFNTQQNLDTQIISLITTLVNIYTILLLISSIITFLFINSLTRSLRLVADSFKNVNLKKNELIDWPYKDEIGVLVKEYNKMVSTVEENARSLVLDERQSAWREMAQQVAHEIKNPLTPMKLNIQYLQQAINTNHPDIVNLTKRVSSSIIEQIDNLNYIASEFSNFAKLPENKTERIDLKSMLERIVLLFAGDKKVKISYTFPDIPVVVFADKSQMLRIFTNIVQNAVESIDSEVKEGEVKVELIFSSDNDAVIIKVSDNGEGIPKEVQDKIFDPYFTTKSSGTGLGLAMTKKIIELWGGSIRFESEHGKGTTFFLTVPLGT